MLENLAPVILFCYNRPLHLKRTIEALRANNLASETHLYVYSDGYKGNTDRGDVLGVRAYLMGLSGFKTVEVIEAPTNKGLANSVIDGVSDVIGRYDRVIVLEDDMITSTDFLEFMNRALNTYLSRKDIFSITGYGPPINLPKDYKEDLYMAPRASSWGWGTWADRWALADWGATYYKGMLEQPRWKEQFVRGGNDLWPMLYKQQRKIIDSWAVRWCATLARYEGYGVYPVRSKIKNIGTDGTGTNFTFTSHAYEVEIDHDQVEINHSLCPDLRVEAAFKDFYDMPFYLRVKNWIKFGLR
jgi:hypothetical protein